jgi:hypothetical protein
MIDGVAVDWPAGGPFEGFEWTQIRSEGREGGRVTVLREGSAFREPIHWPGPVIRLHFAFLPVRLCLPSVPPIRHSAAPVGLPVKVSLWNATCDRSSPADSGLQNPQTIGHSLSEPFDAHQKHRGNHLAEALTAPSRRHPSARPPPSLHAAPMNHNAVTMPSGKTLSVKELRKTVKDPQKGASVRLCLQ